MPSVIVKTIFFDLDKLAWTLTAGGNALLQPLTIGQNDTIDFNVQFIKSGAAQTLTSPTFTAGIKVLNGFSDSFVVQFGAPTGTPPTYTFTATISSTELSAALLTGAQFAIEFRDSTNGIVTLPALTLNIVASYTISGTTPTSANGTLVVAATKTVTFPQSLTFPSALGTNGFQLTTDGAGALTWAASGALTDGDKGDITVSNSGATFTIDNDVVGLAQLAHMPTARVIGRTTAGNGSPELLTISGTGSVAMTNTPTLVTPVLGSATATSINGITISAGGSGTLTMAGSIDTSVSGGNIETHNNGGGIFTYGGGGAISTSTSGGSISTSNGGGSISTTGTGSIELGVTGTRTTFRGNAATVNKTIDLPNLTGTVVVTAATSATATQALFAQATGFPAYRAIATADIATALTTPGAIGGTTASTGAFTTLTSSSTTDSTTTATGAIQTLGGLGVAKSIFAGGIINIPATTSTVGQITQAGVPLIHSFKNASSTGTEANIWIGGAGNLTLTGSSGSTNGLGNVGIGSLNSTAITTGYRNLAIGTGAGGNCTTGTNNVSVGYTALQYNSTGGNNVAIGSSAGRGAGAGSTVLSDTVSIGFDALKSTTAACQYTVAIGYAAGDANTTGAQNTFVGVAAGRPTTTGGNNTCVGSFAYTSAVGASYQTVLGSGAVGTADNQVMLGRAADIVTLPGGLVTVPIAQTATTAAVSVAVTTTALTTTGVAQAITLANGTNGQIKIIAHIANGGTGTAVLTPATSAADYNTITFSSVGDTATLQYHTTGGWYILSLRGAVAA